MCLSGNRKGQLEIVGIVLVVFFIFMGILLGSSLLNKVSEYSYSTMPSEAQNALNKGSNMLKFLDSMSIVVLVIYAVLVVGLSTSGFSGNKAALFLSFIIFIPVLLFSGSLSKFVQDSIAGSSFFGDLVVDMPVTYNIVVYLPVISLIIGVVDLVFIYVSSRSVGGV